MAIAQALLIMLLIDLAFLGVLVLLLSPLFLYKHAAYAVLKRNFVGYFSNPTGYVFLCMFVLLSSFAAFWPHEFFTANLANLDQLNLYLPLIMLVFIPAITMSIWSDERRQGTDELLLTLPAGDFDIVIGKYLAAAAIFTASLMFSQISNFTVLLSLAMGDVDLGLFLTTYLGYWLTGLAMLSIGMVSPSASFSGSSSTCRWSS
ncbi:MAG: ABC-2 transporter permease [Pirellulaceae bacterium]|nr:ABC-2 transporter permease [Pirellulaceae bacterium]